ncbi:MAG: dioxygenase [Phenylobacterium sp.]
MSSIVSNQGELTDVVLSAMAGADSPRLRTVMESLVRHLHAFARDVALTEEELDLGVDFLNRVGQATHDAHNEGILLADILGLSTLVCLMNNGHKGGREAGSALLGPFWRMNAPVTPNGGSIVRCSTQGERLTVTGRVRDTAGAPVAGARVDVWQASPVGLYENQDPTQADMNLRGVFVTDADGVFSFETIRPAGYPVPTDGPSGELLRAQHRSPFRPAHIHFLLHKPGLKTLISQVFVDSSDKLENDVVFGATADLVAELREAGDGAWTLDYDFVMEPGEARLPKPPIK